MTAEEQRQVESLIALASAPGVLACEVIGEMERRYGDAGVDINGTIVFFKGEVETPEPSTACAQGV